MRKIVVSLAGAALAALATTGSAHATLQIWLDVGGTIVTCADGQACDTNPNPGQLSIANQTVNGVQILGFSATQAIAPPQNSLNTSSFELINTNGTSVSIEAQVSGTGYAVPITGWSASGGGTWQNATNSDITLGYFIDPTDTQGAPGTPGTEVTNFANTAPATNPDSFSFNQSGADNVTTPFSMTLDAAGTLVAGGQLVGRTQALVNTVPEPASLILFGTGLIGMGVLRRRRRRRVDPTSA